MGKGKKKIWKKDKRKYGKKKKVKMNE
jgi:hypothetical protein